MQVALTCTRSGTSCAPNRKRYILRMVIIIVFHFGNVIQIRIPGNEFDGYASHGPVNFQD
jgi:hypothetical protein